MPRHLLHLISCCFALAVLAAAASPAGAAWFTGDTIVGPTPVLSKLGNVDLSRDGTGAVVYIADEGGVPHVFVSRKYGGEWRAPERVDGGIETAATEAAVTTADDARMAIVFISGGRLYGSVATGGAPSALPAPAQLYADPDPLKAVANVAVDMGINGTAYAVFTAPGAGGSDVRAVRLQDASWEGVPNPLDIAVDQPAGDGLSRPRVGVSAEGNAVAVWGEGHADGRRRVYGRRVTGLNLSVAPQDISLAEFGGASGGDADSPDIDIEDDGSYAWVVWRQSFGGTSRSLARRLVGSLFETPAPVDAGQPSGAPRMAMNSRGVGEAVAAGLDGTVLGAELGIDDLFKPGVGLSATPSQTPPTPVVAVSEHRDRIIAWRRDSGGGVPAEVRVRLQPDEVPAFGVETVVSRPEWGDVVADSLSIGTDRIENTAVAFLQGSSVDRRLVVAEYDRPPSPAVPLSSSNYQRRSRPILKWRAGTELWGPQTFTVFVDGQQAGTSTVPQLQVPAALPAGPHRWRVTSTDRRGQTSQSKERIVRLDFVIPSLTARVDGKRKRGQLLKFRIRAIDQGGSGLKYVTVTFPGATPLFLAKSAIVSHRFAKAGKVTVALKASDRAGNVARTNVTLRIKK